MLKSLDDVAKKLQLSLENNEASYSSVCIRVLLRTGVSLKEIKPDQRNDQGTIDKVSKVLAEMGYQLS